MNNHSRSFKANQPRRYRERFNLDEDNSNQFFHHPQNSIPRRTNSYPIRPGSNSNGYSYHETNEMKKQNIQKLMRFNTRPHSFNPKPLNMPIFQPPDVRNSPKTISKPLLFIDSDNFQEPEHYAQSCIISPEQIQSHQLMQISETNRQANSSSNSLRNSEKRPAFSSVMDSTNPIKSKQQSPRNGQNYSETNSNQKTDVISPDRTNQPYSSQSNSQSHSSGKARKSNSFIYIPGENDNISEQSNQKGSNQTSESFHSPKSNKKKDPFAPWVPPVTTSDDKPIKNSNTMNQETPSPTKQTTNDSLENQSNENSKKDPKPSNYSPKLKRGNSKQFAPYKPHD